ncbi:MAG: glycosyltransferase [Terrimicrobiaceae bacterium]
METIHTLFVVLAYTAAVGFLIFGIDDVFFDMQFLRYLRGKRGDSPVSLEQLKNEPEKLIAIYIPAWMEGGVINRMAEYAKKILVYDRYDIFIGVYPNDPETNRCVDELTRMSPRIHKAMTRNPGPTSKADCLNAIFQEMRTLEIPGRREYEIIALHDAEDVMHPLTLKAYNHYVPALLDMGQLPVFPLELTPWRYWVGNSYIDEFAEWHVKDMYSREAIGGVVPSAGVGTAFSRKTIDFLAAKHNGGPFQEGNLAEDYMVGLELCRAGFRTGFIDHPVEREIVKRDAAGKVVSTRTITERVAVRENFPLKFYQAVKQKARWIIGTAYQGWQHGGWWGSPAVRYTLMRDRRAPVVHCINAAGYCVMGYVLFEFAILNSDLRNSIFVRPLFEHDGLLWRIILVDTALLVYRVGQKVSCVSDVYGLRQGLFAIPRYPVVNFINMGATIRATWFYLGHRLFDKPLAWTKTMHVFPGMAELQEYSRTIEDLLVEDGYVSKTDLQKSLQQQHGKSAPRALLDLQLIDEDQFLDIWSRFSCLQTRVVTPEDVAPNLLDRWSEADAERFGAMPAHSDGDGTLAFAFAEPPAAPDLQAIAEIMGSPVEARLLRPVNLGSLRNSLYATRVLGSQPRNPVEDAFRELSPANQRRVREFQMLRMRSMADAMTTLRLISPEKVRRLIAEDLGVAEAEFAKLTLSVSLITSLGAFFCESHGLVPLNNGTIAILNPVHPGVEAHVRGILGNEVGFCADTPAAFHTLWHDFLALRFSESALIDTLVETDELTPDHASRIRNMRRLISSPVDRLILQLGLVSRKKMIHALRHTTGLQPAAADGATHGPETEELLAPGFSKRAGVAVQRIRDAGITFRVEGLITENDLRTLMERCAGMPLQFELKPE